MTPEAEETTPPDDAALKQDFLAAALVHFPFDGFTGKTMTRAGTDMGLDKDTVARLFPGGVADLVACFSADTDAKMRARLAQVDMAALKIRMRIALAVKTRIAILRPHKEAARRAAAYLSLPPHAPLAAKLLYHTVDAIWRAAGDTATDFNFYTKRGILAGVYSSTLLRWFNDNSEDEGPTDAFLAARIENVMQFERLKARTKKNVSRMMNVLKNHDKSGAPP
jgi:ubiquinone biosynthesis protein COQ9